MEQVYFSLTVSSTNGEFEQKATVLNAELSSGSTIRANKIAPSLSDQIPRSNEMIKR